MPKNLPTTTTPIPTFQNLATDYKRAKQMLKEIDVEYELKTTPIKEAIEEIKKQLLCEFARTNQISVKFQDVTISKTVKKTLQIVNMQNLVDALKKKKMAKDYVIESVNDLFKDTIAPEIEKGNYDVLPGTVIRQTESITYRAAKDETKDRRIVYSGSEKKLLKK